MCYSAMAEQDFRKINRLLRAFPDYAAFEAMYAERLRNSAINELVGSSQ